MRTKLVLGAAFALAAVGIGCSSSKSSGGGFFQPTEVSAGNFPASSIAQNNVGQDGGGFSNNNQTASFGSFICSFNNKNPNCDAPTTADGSAVFFFVTTDLASAGQPAGRERVYVSYFNGSQFSPPQEITAKDRNEALNAGTPCATHAMATVLIPLNTSQYKDGAGATNSQVSANAGNWAVLWDYETFSQSPALVIPDVVGDSLSAVTDAVGSGAHHTVALNWVIKAQVANPDVITNLIGNTATTGAPNGPATELKFGVQIVGTEITLETAGASAGNAAVNFTPLGTVTAGFKNSAGQGYRPASDVISFGAASDTFCHCAFFQSTLHGGNKNDDPSGLVQGSGTAIGNVATGNANLGPTEADGSGGNVGRLIQANPAKASVPSGANYTNGDNTSFIQLFWCQLVTSHAGANTTTLIHAGTAISQTQVGPMYRMFTGNINLASMAVGGQQIVPFPTAPRNSIIGGSTQALPAIACYNNIVFWNYADASLAVSPSGASGTVDGIVQGIGAQASTTQVDPGSKGVSVALACLSVTTGVAGAAAINTTNQFDVTLLGTAGHHQNTNNTLFTSGTTPVDVGEELVTIAASHRLCACPAIGPDEGQVDLTVFVTGQISTTSAANVAGGHSNLQGDVDTELWAVAVNVTGATAGTLIAGTKNPFRVSNHVADPPQPTPSGSNWTRMTDDVNSVNVTLNRNGLDALVTFVQAQGTSQVANLGLMATAYRPFRIVAAGTSAPSATVPTLDQRFPTVSPVQVNTPSLTVYSAQRTDIGDFGLTAPVGNSFNGSPVAAYQVQGFVGYKCGFQTDPTKVALVWVHADGTSERVFVKNVTMTNGANVTDPPTLTATGTEAELETGNLVPQPQTGSPVTANVPFLNNTFAPSIPTWRSGRGGNPGVNSFNKCAGLGNNDTLLTSDAGPDTAGNGGDTLIVFTKVVDFTTSDGNFFDKKCIAVLYDGTTLTRTVLSKNIRENTTNGFRTALVSLVPNSASAALTTSGALAGGHSPDGGVYVYWLGPNDDNGSSPAGLYTRHFRARKVGGTVVTFSANFFPDTTAATFVNPTRIDRDLNTNVTTVLTFTKGRQCEVLFVQDNHIWGQVTNDGENYAGITASATGVTGLAAPALFDNNFSVSANGSGGGITLGAGTCTKIDGNCDNTSGTPVFFIKDDVDLNPRLYVRLLN